MPTTEADVKNAAEKVKGLVLESVKNDEDIQKAMQAGEGVADLKEQQEKRNGETVEAVDSLKERVDELEMAKNRPSGDGAPVDADHVKVDMARGLAQSVKQSGVTSNDPDKVVRFNVEDAKGNDLADDAPGRKARMTKSGVHKDVSVVDDTVYEPDYRAGIIQPAERQLTMRDLIPVVQTNSHTIYHIREESFTDNAGMQPGLGELKPESDFEISAESQAMKTVAHFIKVPTQLLDDVQSLEGHLRNRMGFLLDQAEEEQILYGDGTGQNLTGLFPNATAFDESLMDNVTAPQSLDRIRMGIAQVARSNYSASGVVLNPVDWGEIELTKDGQNAYIFASPQEAAGPRMWGLPVNATNAINSGDFMTGAFNLAAELYEKMSAQISISTEDVDNFQRNLATVRAEKRVVLAILRPLSFVKGDLNAPTS